MEHTEREIDDEQMFVKGEKRKEKRRQEKRGGVFWLAGGGDYERSEYSQQASQPYAFEINL